jgi:hypothetical protein
MMARSGWHRRRPQPGTTTTRGYSTRHQQLRTRLLAALQPGTPCPQTFPDGTTCGQPMWRTQALHLGHTDDRSQYLGLVHAACNLRAAAMHGNRKARTGRRQFTTSRRW